MEHRLKCSVGGLELAKQVVVRGAVLSAGLERAADRAEAVDIVQRRDAKRLEGEEGGCAITGVDGVGEGMDGAADHVGEDARPSVGAGTTAGEAQLRVRVARELLDSRKEPAKAEGHSFEYGAHHSGAVCLQSNIDERAPSVVIGVRGDGAGERG